MAKIRLGQSAYMTSAQGRDWMGLELDGRAYLVTDNFYYAMPAAGRPPGRYAPNWSAWHRAGARRLASKLKARLRELDK